MRQSPREKLSVTLDRAVCDAVRRHARATGQPASRVVEDALRRWQRYREAALAREGYEQLAEEDVADALAYAPALEDLELGGDW